MYQFSQGTAKPGERSSNWFPHRATGPPGGGSLGRSELPDAISKLVREGVVLVQGPAGCGKSQLGSSVRDHLREGRGYKFVVKLDFAKAVKELTVGSWKGRTDWDDLDVSSRDLTQYLVREGELGSKDEAGFLELLLQNDLSEVALVADNMVASLRGYLTRLLCETYGGRKEKVATIEGLARHLFQQQSHSPHATARKITEEERKLEGLVKRLEEFFKQLFRGPVGRLLLTRHESTDLVYTDLVFKIGEFEDPRIALLFIKRQLTEVHKVTRTQPLELYLSMHPLLKSLTVIPRMAAILCSVYSRDIQCVRGTETLLLHRIILGWMKTELPQMKEESLYKLPREEKDHFVHFSRLAFESLTHSSGDKNEPFSLLDIEVNTLNLRSGYASLEDVKKFGLVQCKGNVVEKFLHPVVKEFMAAFYVSCLPQNDQISFYYDHFPKNARAFLNVSLFHFGLTRLETEEFLNPSKIILAALIESLAHVAEKETGNLHFELQKLIIGCLYECQDATLVKHFTHQNTPLMDVSFPDVRALDDARLTTQMSFVILQSGISSWEIVIPCENVRGKTDSVVFPILMAETNVKVEVKVQPSPSQGFKVRARFESRAPRRTGRATEMLKRATNDHEREFYFRLAMICTGQRETLHRVTQLYSPIPIRSDAGDPAYASFITCDCVEKPLEREVTFEPVHPIHMIQLGTKSKKARAGEGERDATTRRHMEQKHKNAFMEIIILNRPSVRSITFNPPGGRQPCRLVMSQDETPPSMSGRIAMVAEVEKSQEDPRSWVTCVSVSGSERGETVMVTHTLPLPKSKSKKEAENEGALQAGEVSGTRVHNDDIEVPATAAQAAPSHKAFNEPDLPPTTSPALAQAETEKITWRPGMIMTTTIPDVFQKFKTYSLPAEDNQLRRGGNGQIFATEYFGLSLVAKKTMFRNREYNVIVKLKHANIVPLLALMVGEATGRRRFFCYHMLPRMSADAARMLSDHPELTLAALKETNSDDPRKFGLALGNMRYLLAEVLKGLAYMHGLHILHRDLKASNILVRFHCSHDNLLWCTCPNKYTVCVCDFDAALELDSEDRMLPVTPSNKMFYLPPVGTHGFRSPEGTQLMVASHREAISPQLTPKTDIWSLGILMLRLFIGQDGPSSQRQNAILLLKYHQSKGNREGRHRYQKNLVEDYEVENLLKLPILRAKLSGVRNLVDFVSHCLELDPDKRPSAKDLLHHKFLY